MISVRLKDLQNSEILNPEERFAKECDRIEGKISELGARFHDSWGVPPVFLILRKYIAATAFSEVSSPALSKIKRS
jgi:hypothetical protein